MEQILRDLARRLAHAVAQPEDPICQWLGQHFAATGSEALLCMLIKEVSSRISKRLFANRLDDLLERLLPLLLAFLSSFFDQRAGGCQFDVAQGRFKRWENEAA